MLRKLLILIIILLLGYFGYWLIDRSGAIELKEKISHIFGKNKVILSGTTDSLSGVSLGDAAVILTPDLLGTGIAASGESRTLSGNTAEEAFFDTTTLSSSGKQETGTIITTPTTTPNPPVKQTTIQSKVKKSKDLLHTLFQ